MNDTQIMDIKEFRKILHYSPSTDSPIEEQMKTCKAHWIYQGREKEPHAILTSGLHSNEYFLVNRFLQFTNREEWVAKLLADLIRKKLGIEYIDCVVSSSYAAITLGRAVANEFKSAFVFTEKKNGKQTWTGRFYLPEKARLLHLEEVITSFKTTAQVKNAVLLNNPNIEFLEFKGKPVVCTFVYRPPNLKKNLDYEVISLIEKESVAYKANECPLCEQGSLALKPKGNWMKFIN